jgi:CheY-like chemotaxis protein
MTSDQASHVMLVEDEAITAMLLHRALKTAGFRVSPPVSSGEQAVALAAELRPDVVVMDLRLVGEMDGLETAIAINESRRTPIVFTTGYCCDELSDQVPTGLVFLCLEKPVLIPQIIKAIRLILPTEPESSPIDRSRSTMPSNDI